MSGKCQVFQLWPRMVSINQIARLFDHQHFLEESINILIFFH